VGIHGDCINGAKQPHLPHRADCSQWPSMARSSRSRAAGGLGQDLRSHKENRLSEQLGEAVQTRLNTEQNYKHNTVATELEHTPGIMPGDAVGPPCQVDGCAMPQ
jgi:hypothetical protein